MSGCLDQAPIHLISRSRLGREMVHLFFKLIMRLLNSRVRLGLKCLILRSVSQQVKLFSISSGLRVIRRRRSGLRRIILGMIRWIGVRGGLRLVMQLEMI